MASEAEREKYPYLTETEEFRCAHAFGWDYRQIMHCPREWRFKMLLMHEEQLKIDAVISDLMAQGKKRVDPRTGIITDATPNAGSGLGAERGIPMREWKPELFTGAQITR